MTDITKEQAGALVMSASAPKVIATYQDCEEAVGWLRTKALFDKAVDAAHDAAVKAAHTAHKAAIKARDNLKAPSDKARTEVRAMVEAYAENPAHQLPEGVFRRRTFQVVVTDPEAVPRHYLTPDIKLIEGVVKRTEGAVKIPGVEIIEETAVTVRTEAE